MTLDPGPRLLTVSGRRLTLVSRDEPSGPRQVSGLECVRVYAAAGTGAVLAVALPGLAADNVDVVLSGTDLTRFVTVTAVTGEVSGRKEISTIIVPNFRRWRFRVFDTEPLSVYAWSGQKMRLAVYPPVPIVR